ncbi:hypothetical protein D3C85_881920 [compost metagenome]
MVAPRAEHHADAWAGAVAVLLLGNVAQLVGGFHVETVVAQPCEKLPLIVEANLVLDIHRTAVHFGVVVTGNDHAPVMLLAAIRVVQIQARYRLGARAAGGRGIQGRVAVLVAQLQPGQQGMAKAECLDRAFQLQVIEDVLGGQVLLPALARDAMGGGVVAGQVGVVEIAVELEHAQGMAQLPAVGQFVAQFRAQGLGLVVYIVALGVAIGGLDVDIGRASVDPGNATVRGAVVATVLILHQPVEVRRQLPAHRGGEQLAVAIDAVTEAVVVLVAHVQAQADVVRRVGAQVCVQATQVFTATLHLNA